MLKIGRPSKYQGPITPASTWQRLTGQEAADNVVDPATKVYRCGSVQRVVCRGFAFFLRVVRFFAIPYTVVLTRWSACYDISITGPFFLILLLSRTCV